MNKKMLERAKQILQDPDVASKDPAEVRQAVFTKINKAFSKKSGGNSYNTRASSHLDLRTVQFEVDPEEAE